MTDLRISQATETGCTDECCVPSASPVQESMKHSRSASDRKIFALTPLKSALRPVYEGGGTAGQKQHAVMSTEGQGDNLRAVDYRISGMDCPSCAETITRRVMRMYQTERNFFSGCKSGCACVDLPRLAYALDCGTQ